MSGQDQPRYVDCAAVIVTYNSARHVDALLDSLPGAAADLTLRIIVVDNGSADDTVARVRTRADVICVETRANLGYSGGINVGRQYIGDCGAIAILNPDLVLEVRSIREMFAALTDDPAVGMAVPMLRDSAGSLDLSLRREPTLLTELGDALFGHHFRSRPARLSETVRREQEYCYRHAVDWAGGAAMLISSACDRTVGSWDERFFLYMEEVDYAARIRAAGFLVMYVPEAQVLHVGGGSGRSPGLLALMAVNRVRYFEKYGRPAGLLRAVVLFNSLLRVSDSGHRAAVRAVSRRSTWEPMILRLCGRRTAKPLQGSEA